MNKAFVREPEEPDDLRCPACGIIGAPIGPETRKAHLPPETGKSLSNSASFCGNPGCGVGYFDAFGQTVEAKLLRGKVYPKFPDGPVCCCFGLSAGDVMVDAQRGDPKRVRDIIARSKSSDARCAAASPSGQCCVAELQKLYLKRAGQR